MSTYRKFRRPRSIEEYGFDADGPIRQPDSPSGFLLGWDALDAHAEAVTSSRWCPYIIVGETVRDDGMRFPELARRTLA